MTDTTVYAAYKYSNKYPVIFSNESAAEKYRDAQGNDAEGDPLTQIIVFKLYDTYAEFARDAKEQLIRRAKSKLTMEEQEALGV